MWSEEEIKYLKENYKKFTNKELGKYLNRTPISIEKKLSRLNLKKGIKGNWSINDINYLKDNYGKLRNKDIAKKLNRSSNSILSKATKLGLSKDIQLISNRERLEKLSKFKYKCKICDDYGTNSIKGLSIHLSKIHPNILHNDYYLKHIGNKVNCYYCGNTGKFIDMVSGYRDLCESDGCLSLSRSTQSVEYLLRQGYSEKDALVEIENKNVKVSNSGKKTVKKRLKKNPNFTKEKSPNCKEFYLKRGYSEEESVKLSSDVVLNMQETSHKKRKENPDDYLHTYNTKVEYYVAKGYSEEESYNMLVDRQTTFSKEICIEKYGEEEGIEIWLDRQEKWLKTLDDKTDEEKKEINRKKMFCDTGYSKISNELFDLVYDKLSKKMKNKSYYSSVEKGEFVRYDKINKKHYRLDFVNSLCGKVIEFNGDFWHCNPKKYNKDYYHKIWKKTAKEIWEYDKIKEKFITDKMGYDLLIIWEDEYRNNKKETIQKCIDFLEK